MSLTADLAQRVRAWIAADPNETDRAELSALLARAAGDDDDAAAAVDDLNDRFAELLAFGTAGLRGAIGAGPNRMNAAVVTRATAAVCQVLREELGEGFTVAIGYDARHRSDEFARIAAGVVQAAGGRATLQPGPLPTPMLAWVMGQLDCDAGIMVTASHNPPADNGYKLYLGGRIVPGDGRGVQIVAPWDARIYAAMQDNGPARDIPVAADGWAITDQAVLDAYVARAASLADGASADVKAGLRVVLTSMHGVGAETCLAALDRAGFADVSPVAEQRDPDPDFPTVAFPNPEEAGALDLAMDLARRVSADVIIANDPDADRCSAAVPDAAASGGWRQLTGDEIGWLLGAQAAAGHVGDAGAVLARSIVSSRQLARIADAAGCGSAVTLTGFKWIARTPGMVFGYEEAIGYCTDPDGVRDKDGISAAVRIAQLAAEAKAAGRTLSDTLDDLALAHGLHVTAPLTFRVADLGIIQRGMARLRDGGGPPRLAGEAVTFTQDYAGGGVLEGCELPATDALEYTTDAGDRVVARPSGTEPKLKCYLETIVPVADRADLPAARERAAERIAAMKADMTAALGFEA